MAAALQSRPRFAITVADRARAGVRNVPIRIRYFPGDLAVERFLHELGEYRCECMYDNCSSAASLLAFRDDFRQIIAYRPCAGLREFLGVCPPNHSAFLIGVWLLGRCATRQATYILEQLPADRSPQARKHFARALKRVEYWPRLRRLASDFPDEIKVKAAANETPSDPFTRRLQRFAMHVDKSHAAEAALASQMPLWIRDANWRRTDPKRTGWIRTMLERIKQWVRGESTV